MATIREILTDALALFGGYGVGEDPTDDDLQDAFRAFNSMRGQWANERLLHPVAANSLFTWPAGQASRTVGPTGDFVIAAGKPLSIEEAFIRLDSNDYDLRIITKADYENLVQKGLQSSLPGYLMYDPGENNITGTLYLWPVSTQNLGFNIDYIAPMKTYATIDDTFVDPEGYQEAETYNLALRLAPKYGKVLADDHKQIARDSLAAIKRNNSDMDEMDFPGGLGGSPRYWNAQSGWWA